MRKTGSDYWPSPQQRQHETIHFTTMQKQMQCFSVEDIPDVGNPTYIDLPALGVPAKQEESQHDGL